LSINREQSQESSRTSGTLAYMAPEVFLGQPSTEAADMYAVGIIAYELIIGKHPFDLDNLTVLSNQILNHIPDFSTLAEQPALQAVLKRLLAKDPADRFQSVDEVMAELSRAIGRPLPVETAATRESFLQAARFVGRERQVGRLKAALEE